MTKRVIVLNGCPNVGKDIVANHFKLKYNYHHREFKGTLFQITWAVYGVTEQEWREHYTREKKELPWDKLGGLSPRQALIFISEKIIKKNFSSDFFGKTLANSITDGVTFVSDSGFDEELVPLVDAVGVENILFIRIHRDGCTYEGDSRSYLYPERTYKDFKAFDVWNNSSPDELFEVVESIIKNIGWKL